MTPPSSGHSRSCLLGKLWPNCLGHPIPGMGLETVPDLSVTVPLRQKTVTEDEHLRSGWCSLGGQSENPPTTRRNGWPLHGCVCRQLSVGSFRSDGIERCFAVNVEWHSGLRPRSSITRVLQCRMYLAMILAYQSALVSHRNCKGFKRSRGENSMFVKLKKPRAGGFCGHFHR